ncbi:MAG TPA: hypothetical protein VIX81_08925 [Gammaproteobacteria bacterium]
MTADKLVDDAVSRICAVVSTELSAQDQARIRHIVAEMAVAMVNHTADECSDNVRRVYGPQTDIAHQIADEIKRRQVALIANLQSMR